MGKWKRSVEERLERAFASVESLRRELANLNDEFAAVDFPELEEEMVGNIYRFEQQINQVSRVAAKTAQAVETLTRQVAMEGPNSALMEVANRLSELESTTANTTSSVGVRLGELGIRLDRLASRVEAIES